MSALLLNPDVCRQSATVAINVYSLGLAESFEGLFFVILFFISLDRSSIILKLSLEHLGKFL